MYESGIVDRGRADAVRRLALAAVVLLLIGGGPTEPEIPNCDEFQNEAEYEACRAYVEELLEQQQQQMAIPEQLAYPNAPTETTVVVLDGGSSIGEWAALLAGIASLVAALEVFRRRRHRAEP